MENTLLNLIPAAYLPEVHISQYDIGRTLTFNLKEGASDYNVPTGATVTVKATKPSGFGFAVPCTFSGGVVTLVVTETMTPEHGRFPAELSIVSGNTTIGTSNFIFNIERSPHPEGTIDGDAETIIPELTLLVERIEAAAEDVDEKAELFLNLSAEAETLPAGSLATASYSDGVLTLGIPRGYDGDDTKADAIIKSASGEVASFTDGGNGLLVKSLNVNIVPKQSGSGDPSPSNVRPISGWNGVNVEQRGKNLLSDYGSQLPYSELGVSITGSGGEYTMVVNNASGYPFTRICTLKGLKKGTYRISSNAPVGGARIMNRSVSPAVQVGNQTNRFILTEDITDNLSVELAFTGSQLTNGTYYIKVQLELGSTATPFEPYQGTSYPISLGQTVYGGTLEVMSGKLTAFPYYSSYNGQTLNGEWICDRAVYSQGVTPPTGSQVVDMSGTGSELTLTPTEVKTLLGNNNIWSDSGTVEVEYRADTTLAYNELLSLIASLS